MGFQIRIDAPKGGARRLVLFVGLPLALVMTAGLLARAYDDSWIASGAPIDAVKLKSIFDEIQTRLTALETPKAPTTQVFKSGVGLYNTPTGVRYIRVRMVGGGGGGSASAGNTTNENGSAGGATNFGTSYLVAGGGGGGGTDGFPGAAGVVGAVPSGLAGIFVNGGAGGPGGNIGGAFPPGGNGAASPWGGAGTGGYDGAGSNAQPNTGSGGGGVEEEEARGPIST
jgi:hypothetical protein